MKEPELLRLFSKFGPGLHLLEMEGHIEAYETEEVPLPDPEGIPHGAVQAEHPPILSLVGDGNGDQGPGFLRVGNVVGVHGQVAGDVGLARPQDVSHDAFALGAEARLPRPFHLVHGVQGGVAAVLSGFPNAQEEVPEGDDDGKGGEEGSVDLPGTHRFGEEGEEVEEHPLV